MSYRNLIIENPAKLSIRNNQLIIHTDEDHSVPIEDVSSILIESRQSVISLPALAALAANGSAVFICDERHMPCAVLTPYQQYCRQLSILDMQINATEPFKKRIWQTIIKSKITNQGVCLELTGHSKEAAKMYAMAERVCSGDTGNIEAAAARYYFPVLMGKDFTRSDDNGKNICLNYGYAIIRGCIARSLAVSGFIPSLGIHHCNELNAFNLADDLIEPYRPLIDLMVAQYPAPNDRLTNDVKRYLFNSLNMDVLSGEQHHNVSYAVERTVFSLSRSYESKSVNLVLPQLIHLIEHRII